MIDCYSRRVTGWAIAERMRTELVEDVLRAAHGVRGGLTGAIFHTDYAEFGLALITEVNTHPRISRNFAQNWGSSSRWARSVPADNLLAESFNAALNAKPNKTTPAGPTRPAAAAAAKSSGGWSTTPNATQPWATSRQPSTLRHAGKSTPRWPAAPTSRTNKPDPNPGGLRSLMWPRHSLDQRIRPTPARGIPRAVLSGVP